MPEVTGVFPSPEKLGNANILKNILRFMHIFLRVPSLAKPIAMQPLEGMYTAKQYRIG